MYKINLNDLEDMENRQRANIVNSLSGFKSPMLIGTVNKKSSVPKENLAIFSNIFHIGSSPALIGIFFRPSPEDTQRHTLENIKESKFFTLNYLTENIIEQAHQTSARYSQDESEFQATGLTSHYIDQFHSPFVKDSPLSLAMKLEEHIQVKTNNTSIVIASIQSIYSKSQLITNDILELEEHSRVAVKGLDTYLSLEKIIKLKYAKPQREYSPCSKK